MGIATTAPMSLDEYLAYSDGTDQRYELIDGILVEMGAESNLNVQIASFLFAYFLGLGVPYYLLTSKTEIAVGSRAAKTRYPDLMVMTQALDEKLLGSARSVILPDMPAPQLVVEVVSPGEPGEENYDRDYVEKRREYAARKIPEYWIVDPTHRRVLVLVLRGTAYQKLGTFCQDDYLQSPSFPTLDLTAERVLQAGR